MFNPCCSSRKLVAYSHEHHPVPFNYGNKINRLIKILLLYVPNIDSKQSRIVPFLDDPAFEQIVFDVFMRKMGMVENTDVEWLSSSSCIPPLEMSFFDPNFCDQCQKIIICKYSTQTKIKNVLRTIRNCIAHGDFVVKNDYFVGFNENKGKYKAIIKLKMDRLLSYVELISKTEIPVFELEAELMYKDAFIRCGYSIVENNKNTRRRYDLEVRKNGKNYIVEIKNFSCNRYLDISVLKIFQNIIKNATNGQTFVLITDSEYLKADLKKELKEYSNFKIIDRRLIRYFIKGYDVLDENFKEDKKLLNKDN